MPFVAAAERPAAGQRAAKTETHRSSVGLAWLRAQRRRIPIPAHAPEHGPDGEDRLIRFFWMSIADAR